MTILTQYKQLESLALWQSGDGNDVQEVILQLGETSVTLITVKGGPQLHCALTSITAGALTQKGQEFYLDRDAGDTLIVQDHDMIVALMRIQQNIRGPKKTELLQWALPLTICVALGGVFWAGFAAIPRYAHNYLTPQKSALLAQEILQNVQAQTGQACTTPEATKTLATITTPLQELGQMQLTILPIDYPHIIALPGADAILPVGLVLDSASPAELAGHMVFADAQRDTSPVAARIFQHIGAIDTARFFIEETLPPQNLQNITTFLLNDPMTPPDLDVVKAGFAKTLTPTGPFMASEMAVMMGISWDATNMPAFPPNIADGAWLALQAVCQN